MLTARGVLVIVALILFLIAAKPPAGVPVKFEWLAVVFLLLAWLVQA